MQNLSSRQAQTLMAPIPRDPHPTPERRQPTLQAPVPQQRWDPRQFVVSALMALSLGGGLAGGGWWLHQAQQETRALAQERLGQNRWAEALTLSEQVRRNPWHWIQRDPQLEADIVWLQDHVQAQQEQIAELQGRQESVADGIQLGDLLYQSGDLAGAEQAYQQALSLDPQQSRAHFGLGEVWAARGQGSLEHYQRAAERVPDSAVYQAAVGRALIEQGDFEAGIPLLQQTLARDPYQAEAHLALSKAYAQQQQGPDSVTAALRAWELGSQGSFAYLSQVDGGSPLLQAQVLLVQGRYRQAERAFQVVVETDPELAAAHLGWGRVLLAQERPAVSVLSQALRLDGSAPYQHALGLALWQEAQRTGDSPRMALPALEEAVERDPLHPIYQRDLGVLLAQLGQWQRSLDLLQSVEGRIPGDIDWQRSWAWAQSQQEKLGSPSSSTQAGSPSQPSISVDLGQLRRTEFITEGSGRPQFELSLLKALLVWGSLSAVAGWLLWWALTRTQIRPLAPSAFHKKSDQDSTKTAPPISSAQLAQIPHIYQQALLFAQAGHADKAIPLFEQVLSLDPSYAPAHLHLGQALQHCGQSPLASFRAAYHLQPSLSGVVTSLLECLVAEGEAQIRAGSLATGTEHLREAEQIAEAHPDAATPVLRGMICVHLGEALMGSQAWEDAITELHRAIDICPDMGRAHCSLADLHHGRGHMEQAIETYWHTLNIDADLVAAHHGLGRSLIRQGQLRAGVASFKTALHLTSHPSPAFLVDLGLALIWMGNLAEASTHLDRALIMDPTFARAHYALGQLKLAQHHYPEALNHLDQALEWDPELWDAVAAQGLAILAQKQHTADGKKVLQSRQVDTAIRKFETVLHRDPRHVEAHFGLGELHRIQGHLQFALKSYQAGLESNRSYAPIHYRLGGLYARWGQFGKAIEALRTALWLHPSFAEATEMLQRVYAKQDKALRQGSQPQPKPTASRGSVPSAQRLLKVQADSHWEAMTEIPDVPTDIEGSQTEIISGGEDPQSAAA